MLVSLILFVYVSRHPSLHEAIADPSGLIDRGILGRLNALCEQLEQECNLTVAIHVDTVIADQSITSRAEKLVEKTSTTVSGEWVALYLLENGECYYTGSKEFLINAEAVGVLNLDLIVMKEHELSGIDNALEVFLSNVTYVANVQGEIFSDSKTVTSNNRYTTLLIQVALAFIFAIGLSVLLFDLLISRSSKEVSKIPTPLFGGDFIAFESTLFGAGLNENKRSSS